MKLICCLILEEEPITYTCTIAREILYKPDIRIYYRILKAGLGTTTNLGKD